MEKRAAEPEAEVERRPSAAQAADAEEDRAFGRDKSGEQLTKWVADKKKRAEKIRSRRPIGRPRRNWPRRRRPERRPRPRSGDKPRPQETGQVRRRRSKSRAPKRSKNLHRSEAGS